LEVREFAQVFFEPRFGLRMLGFIGLYRSLFPEVTGPVVVTGPGEPELQLHHTDEEGHRETVVAVRPRDKGYAARVSFCCARDHGFKLEALEARLGLTVKIEPKSPNSHMVRLMVDHAYNPFSPELVNFMSQAHQSYRNLVYRRH